MLKLVVHIVTAGTLKGWISDLLSKCNVTGSNGLTAVSGYEPMFSSCTTNTGGRSFRRIYGAERLLMEFDIHKLDRNLPTLSRLLMSTYTWLCTCLTL
jgi:hypothetical protein